MIGEEPKNEIIDTSTPEALERDFYAWLKGELFPTPQTPTTPSSNTISAPTFSLPPIEQLSLGTSLSLIKKESDSLNDFDSKHHLCFIKRESDLLSDGFSPSPSLESSSSTETSPTLDGPSHFHQVYSMLLKQQMDGVNDPMSTEFQNLDRTSNVFQYEGFSMNMSSLVKIEEDHLVEKQKRPSNPNANSRNSGTNQLGRTYNPGLPLSMQERQRIVSLYRAGWKICDISKQLCVTHSCVSKILHRFRQTGSVKPKDAKEGRMESPLVKAIRDYRTRLGIFRQSEIREQLIKDGLCRKENAPSRSSINHILRTKLDLRLKRK